MKLKPRHSSSLGPSLGQILGWSFFVVASLAGLLYVVYPGENIFFDPKKEKYPPIPDSVLLYPPLEFLTFDASRRGQGIELRWTAANDASPESSFYEVEKISEGRFLTLATLEAQGEPWEVQTFRFVDSFPHFWASYRLKKVNSDGGFIYSSPLSFASTGEEPAFSATPSSEGDRILLRFNPQPLPRKIWFQLFSSDHQLIYEKKLKLASKEPDTQLQTGHLESGIYLLFARGEDGSVFKTQKIILP